ncbi:unknown protein (plasmid) [Synechocystis sp. PCC 6803]|uniref:Uncharacterized protein n=1 Tax=Synechocystis sp. (strain ATCC 27184 / PCC 6803 / Kazusa) TaxID=1111708 RepID=Q6ZEE6_SYNY3|nr:hypothetical protein MYO_4500 [Synechocystis sp. PCC 6803]AVP91459.1 hypothetical protein C7I86_16945 [Synechocystis sp. IPPAS B-1465]MCW5241469.1 hypothetical protein [Synechocystis sp. PCC 6803]BAD01954.1 unknown protein [Synechocystis sp. PCC 6803]
MVAPSEHQSSLMEKAEDNGVVPGLGNGIVEMPGLRINPAGDGKTKGQAVVSFSLQFLENVRGEDSGGVSADSKSLTELVIASLPLTKEDEVLIHNGELKGGAAQGIQ